MPTGRRSDRVPKNLRIEMRMNIDKTGSDNMSLGIDCAFSRIRDFANLGNSIPLGGDISAIRLLPGTVDDRAVLNHNIVSHKLLLRWGACSAQVPCGRRDTDLLCAIQQGLSMFVYPTVLPHRHGLHLL